MFSAPRRSRDASPITQLRSGPPADIAASRGQDGVPAAPTDTRPRVQEGFFAADDDPRADDRTFLQPAGDDASDAEQQAASSAHDVLHARVPRTDAARTALGAIPTNADIDALRHTEHRLDLASRSTERAAPRAVAGAAGRAGGSLSPVVGRRGADVDRLTVGRWRLVRQRLADWLPAGLRGAVVTPAASATLVLAMVALVAAVTATWLAWQHRPVAVSAPATASAVAATPVAVSGEPAARGGAATPFRGDPAEATAAARSTGVGEVVVDVAGRVSHPGVVRLAAGSRVIDAIDRVGGALPGTDTTGIPLARVLVDGEQILVDGQPGPPAPAAGPPAGGGTAGSALGGTGGAGPGGTTGDPVDLNNASVEQLDGLPGVGPVLAQRIVEWRAAHGPFRSPDQLGEVTGVGDRRLADLLPLVRV
ncbi:ComEA family DNA-binding protein [Frankia sp. AgB32]|uniref:helix-hairpin-helix domain-containing protein n=1 Tax=Frankia sp. AgB32 TaxID=631119 RepID=UPI002010996D|nr:ComEA family DNA-binding protein [Frankia sp. AgB32]MCK9895571.1 ComEA family DNA-binding protein [Frankia sp. AgB32]